MHLTLKWILPYLILQSCRLVKLNIFLFFFFQTWFKVDYNLSGEGTITASVPGTQLSSKSLNCVGYQSGVTYPFTLTVTQADEKVPTDMQLVYKVTADPTVWAFTGKITGKSEIENHL